MSSEFLTVKSGEGLYVIEARSAYLGDDIVISVGGGSAPHIGAVSIAVYEPIRDSATVSTITVHTHRDDAVAAYFAKTISREIKCTVTVSAGIHVDDATEADIILLWDNSVKCCNELVLLLKDQREEI